MWIIKVPHLQLLVCIFWGLNWFARIEIYRIDTDWDCAINLALRDVHTADGFTNIVIARLLSATTNCCATTIYICSHMAHVTWNRLRMCTPRTCSYCVVWVWRHRASSWYGTSNCVPDAKHRVCSRRSWVCFLVCGWMCRVLYGIYSSKYNITNLWNHVCGVCAYNIAQHASVTAEPRAQCQWTIFR